MTQAQINQNGWMDNLDDITGNRALSCSDGDRLVAIYNRSTDATPTHSFIVNEMVTGSTMQFSLNNIINNLYYINDMSMSDGVCYFCGMHVTRYPSGLGYVSSVDSSKIGFVGYFKANEVLSGSGQYYLEDIPGTDELTRICATQMGGRQLFCIGYPEDCIFDASGAPSMTCLVDFDFQSASSGFDTWKYNIFLAVHDGEMLMDVSDSHNGILTVSSFSGSHYKIGIRYSKYGPLSSAHNQSMINVINVFDTYSMLVDTRGVNTSWRDAKDRLFIDGSTVAHVSHNAATGDHGVSFYRFDDTYFAINQGITMSDAHYHVANDGVKLIDLRDYMYRGQNGYRDNTSALLDDPQSGLSIIQKETWNNSGMYLTTELNSNWASLMLRSINPYEQNDHLFSVGYRTEDRGADDRRP